MIHWTKHDLETIMCPLCSPSSPVHLRYEFDPFRVVECRQCRLMFLSPRLTQASILKLYQDEAYFKSSVAGQGYDEYLGVRENWLKTFALRLRDIRKYQPRGRVLDVGCGPGFFMEAAVDLGYDVWGVDASAYVVGVARKKFGSRVRVGTLESAGLEPESFDLLTAFDTFEHIYDPLRFLEAARGLLKPRGILTITTPDSTSWLARTSGKRWVSFKIPEHVYYWAPATIARAFQARFKILEVKRAGQYATLGFLFRRLFGLGPKAVGPVQPLLQFLSRISVYADNGSLTVVAAKE